MKFLLSLVLAAAAITPVAHAAQYASDEDRRTQNREEALSKWRADNGSSAERQRADRPRTERTTLRERTRDTARSAKNFTERQVDTVRDFGERTDRRLDKRFGDRPNSENAAVRGGGGN